MKLTILGTVAFHNTEMCRLVFPLVSHYYKERIIIRCGQTVRWNSGIRSCLLERWLFTILKCVV